MKKVLITGVNSYIGVSFENYAMKHYPNEFSIDTIDMIDGSWRNKNFSAYDIVYHVAGIAHSDMTSIDETTKKKYYSVNTELAIETAKKAKTSGVNQFILMSSMIVYGCSEPCADYKRISSSTEPKPVNFYGDSKWQAEKGVRELADDSFIVTILRPPMIYGKGSKGNYRTLSSIAKKFPIFPDIENERSMIYIENFCEFLCQIMIHSKNGIYFPQNAEYTKTSDMVKMISEFSGHKIKINKFWNFVVEIVKLIPGRPRELVNKAFGNLSYDKSMSQYEFNYQIVDLKESIKRTEE